MALIWLKINTPGTATALPGLIRGQISALKPRYVPAFPGLKMDTKMAVYSLKMDTKMEVYS